MTYDHCTNDAESLVWMGFASVCLAFAPSLLVRRQSYGNVKCNRVITFASPAGGIQLSRRPKGSPPIFGGVSAGLIFVNCSSGTDLPAATGTFQLNPGSGPMGAQVLKGFSTVIGLLVIAGSLLYKIPQVLRIWRTKSGEGVSFLMYALETLATTFSAVYSSRRAFPFIIYGEYLFIMGQNALILMLIVFFENLGKRWAILGFLAYVVALLVLYSPVIPLSVLTALQISSIPISNLSRIPQIFLNWKRKSTGQLVLTTLALQLLGSVARVFTTLVRIKDPIVLIGFSVATLFNSTLVGQWLYYNKYRSSAQAV